MKGIENVGNFPNPDFDFIELMEFSCLDGKNKLMFQRWIFELYVYGNEVESLKD